jgi:hypothetical protein
VTTSVVLDPCVARKRALRQWHHQDATRVKVPVMLEHLWETWRRMKVGEGGLKVGYKPGMNFRSPDNASCRTNDQF